MLRAIVPILLCGAVWEAGAAAGEPAACRPLRPAPVATASAAVMRTLSEEPLDDPQPLTPGMILDEAEPAAGPQVASWPIQRVKAAPWSHMKCVPPAPCRTPCYADCIPCEARMFISTAPRCHHQAFHISLRTAVWNALDLHHAMHECSRKMHNTLFRPDPWRVPAAYECR